MVGQGPALVAGPGGECRKECPLVDQAVLQGEQTEEKIPIGIHGGHDAGLPNARLAPRLPGLRRWSPTDGPRIGPAGLSHGRSPYASRLPENGSARILLVNGLTVCVRGSYRCRGCHVSVDAIRHSSWTLLTLLVDTLLVDMHCVPGSRDARIVGRIGNPSYVRSFKTRRTSSQALVDKQALVDMHCVPGSRDARIVGRIGNPSYVRSFKTRRTSSPMTHRTVAPTAAPTSWRTRTRGQVRRADRFSMILSRPRRARRGIRMSPPLMSPPLRPRRARRDIRMSPPLLPVEHVRSGHSHWPGSGCLTARSFRKASSSPMSIQRFTIASDCVSRVSRSRCQGRCMSLSLDRRAH